MFLDLVPRRPACQYWLCLKPNTGFSRVFLTSPNVKRNIRVNYLSPQISNVKIFPVLCSGTCQGPLPHSATADDDMPYPLLGMQQNLHKINWSSSQARPKEHWSSVNKLFIVGSLGFIEVRMIFAKFCRQVGWRPHMLALYAHLV